MTPKIKVDASQAFCKKKGCRERAMHRHHRGHEFLFAHRWSTSKDKNKISFCKRYWQFHKDDVVDLCDKHHAEVHLDLDVVILTHRRDTAGKDLGSYTFKEAKSLVKACREYTDEWLKRETKGVNPDLIFGRGLFSGRKRRSIAARRYHDEKEKGDAGE